MLINTLDQHLITSQSTVDGHLDWYSADTQSTLDQSLDWHLINSQFTVSWLSWSSVDRLICIDRHSMVSLQKFVDSWLRWWSSVDRVLTVCWWRVSTEGINHLVQMIPILFCLQFFSWVAATLAYLQISHLAHSHYRLKYHELT